MSVPNTPEIVTAWQNYLNQVEDWQTIINGITPKATDCGPIYEVPNPAEVGDRPNESFAIADMRGIKVAEPHYHINGETEIYIVISGLGKAIVRNQEHQLEPGSVVVIPPETAHYTFPQDNLVMAVINTPPFEPSNVVPLHETNPAVGFDAEQYARYF